MATAPTEHERLAGDAAPPQIEAYGYLRVPPQLLGNSSASAELMHAATDQFRSFAAERGWCWRTRYVDFGLVATIGAEALLNRLRSRTGVRMVIVPSETHLRIGTDRGAVQDMVRAAGVRVWVIA